MNYHLLAFYVGVTKKATSYQYRKALSRYFGKHFLPSFKNL